MATAPAPAEAEHLTPERREMVEHFVSVTGATEEIALQFLESHDWQLENGVHSYMAIIDDGGDRESSNARNRAEDRDSADERWEEHYMVDEDDMVGHDDSISSETAKDTEQPGSGARGPVRREDSGRDESTARSKSSRSSSAAIEAALDGLGMERLRNFAAEGYAVPQSAAATADDSMESIFPPPKDLMFLGNFDALRKKAEDEKKYCLVNIQRRDEFPSFELNRDTWKVIKRFQGWLSVSRVIFLICRMLESKNSFKASLFFGNSISTVRQDNAISLSIRLLNSPRYFLLI
jgi:hypothetical protein